MKGIKIIILSLICCISIVFNANSQSSISGTLTYNGSALTNVNADVYLFQEINSVFINVDMSSYNNSFSFSNLTQGNYIIKAKILSSGYYNLVPTYYDSTFLWTSADTIVLGSNSTVSTTVKMFEITRNNTGNGFISGNIWYLDPASKLVGEPCQGAEVYLVPQSGNVPIDYTMSDTTGYYEFDSIPLGIIYDVIVDIPGFMVIMNYSVILSQNDLSYQHLDFVIDTSDSGRGIYVTVSSMGIQNKSISSNIVDVYPNPASETLTITNANKSDISIYNLLGEVVLTTKCSNANATINVSGLAMGTYILKVVTAKGVVTKKIVIDK